ncbi:CHAT domain-containing protein [Lacinutrix sp. Hel_I_90]|uniref:CHAT domain-containing protein n=1 Tax=Lacinutrix sp. Hel_I_90 TaxID=1249999 RepID=UPI0005C9896D|nr:CHAT domain-containing tetratricopeptide repeat protein [Lacinutrix sp. Hel_I_90]
MKNSYILFLLFFTFSFTEAQDLEQQIIAATDGFINNSSKEGLHVLNEQIAVFETQLTSKNEYYEFIYLLVNKAYYLNQNNQLNEAIQTYEKAYSLYKKQSILEFDIVEYCLINLGILYHRTNNYTNAENIIKQYLFIAEKNKNVSQQIKGAKNLANLYQKLGKHQSAITIINNALKTKGISPSKRQELNLLKTQSEISLKSLKPSPNPGLLTNNSTLLTYETAYLLAKQKGDYDQALDYFKRLKSSRKTKNQSIVDLAKFKFEEAQLYFLLDDKNKSAEQLQEALKILITNVNLSNGLPPKHLLFAENTFIDIFDLLAELQTNPENTIACYELSFYVSELLEKNITDQQGKLINLMKNRNRSERCISTLYELSKSSDNTKPIARAFSFAERHKAAILKSEIKKKSLLENHPNDSLLLKQKQLSQIQEALRFKLLTRPYTAESALKINNLRDSIHTLSLALKEVSATIEKKYPTKETTTSFEAIGEKLKEDEATLIEYFFGKTNIYQFIISDTTAKLTKIPLSDNTRKSISTFIDYFNTPSAINNNVPKYTNAAFNLYQLLQLQQVKDKQNLIIIPDGFLNFVPFDALLTERTNALKFENMPFVVKSHKLAYVSNVDLYLKSYQPSNSHKTLGVFPVFENENQELKYSIDEAKSLAKEMDVTLLMNDKATKKAFLAQAEIFDILHLSTHASSGDFIEPAYIEFRNSKLYLNELYGLNLKADLVVLSACETGVGVSQRGEGVMSVARGFQYAGAKNVVFSLWQISDFSTSQVMTLFYEKYKDCGSAFEANHFSKLAYLNDSEIKNTKKSPYFWSAFTYHGALTKPKEETTNLIIILLVLAGIALLLLVFYKFKYGK